MNIIAIDPGTRHTGIVYMDEKRIIDAKTVAFPSACGIDQYALDERCRNIWQQIEPFLLTHDHEKLVIEGFIPYTGMKVARSTSHHTPWLVGYILAGLEQCDEDIAIQTSKQVLNPRTRGNLAAQYDMLKHSKTWVYAGDHILTNDHLRTAFLHGWYYLLNRKGD